MASGRAILFLTDNNVPDSVGRYLIERGHDVSRVRDVMSADAKDPVVAEAAMQAGRILVTWDRDFNAQRFMQPRYASLSRIGFSCPEPEGAERLADVIDLLEFSIRRAAGRPVLIRIARDKFQVKDHTN